MASILSQPQWGSVGFWIYTQEQHFQGLHKRIQFYPVHGANMGPTWALSAPCWPHEPCYQGTFLKKTPCTKNGHVSYYFKTISLCTSVKVNVFFCVCAMPYSISRDHFVYEPANESCNCNVTLSLIGWVHTQNDPWFHFIKTFSTGIHIMGISFHIYRLQLRESIVLLLCFFKDCSVIDSLNCWNTLVDHLFLSPGRCLHKASLLNYLMI